MNHLPMPTKYFTLILLLILFSRRSTSARQVSPNQSGSVMIQQPTSWTPSVLDTFHHKYKRTILKLAILLMSKKKFEEFTQALMACLRNSQMVDPKCVIIPLNPESKSKDIASKGEVSPNMTNLGEHIKISGNGPYVFNKRKIWDKAVDIHKSQKPNKKEVFQDLTVYFLCLSCRRLTPRLLLSTRHMSGQG